MSDPSVGILQELIMIQELLFPPILTDEETEALSG